MWLLDVNLPNRLNQLLKDLGLEADTTIRRGWRDLGNGELAEAAVRAGFRVILTRDRLFGESATRALKSFPELAVVILRIPQAKESSFLAAFETAWRNSPITPVAGETIDWLSSVSNE